MDELPEVEGKPEVGKPDEGTYVDAVGKVGGAAVSPKQLPILIETSSMAKSPV